MTDATTVKEKIIISARENIDRNSRRPPAYLSTLRGAGPLDGAKGGFPWEVPSEQFSQILRHMDEIADALEHQLGQVREGIAELRRVSLLPPAEEQVAVTVNVEVEKPEAATPVVKSVGIVSASDEDIEYAQDTANVIEAAVIPPPPAPVNPPAPVTDSAWKCPEHGVFAEGVSRRGNPYRYCPKCGEVDRKTVAG